MEIRTARIDHIQGTASEGSQIVQEKKEKSLVGTASEDSWNRYRGETLTSRTPKTFLNYILLEHGRMYSG